MFCLYCDNPREKCTCRAPVRKCSYCQLPIDLCTCKNQEIIHDGRSIMNESDNDRTMYVTAWKPREEVRRYFSRNLIEHETDSMNECRYCEKLKSHNSDLPYQRLSVFSDVMDELQQKISASTCCTRCKKIPCCCNIEKNEIREDRKIKYCIRYNIFDQNLIKVKIILYHVILTFLYLFFFFTVLKRGEKSSQYVLINRKINYLQFANANRITREVINRRK